MHLSRPERRQGRRFAGTRSLATTAVLAAAAGLLVGLAPHADAAPTPPPNPTNGQISAAQSQKLALARQIGALSGQLVQAQSDLAEAQGRAELAEQLVALRISQLADAKQAATRAIARSRTAAKAVDAATARFDQYIQATYMNGVTGGSAPMDLLTATDPSGLLEGPTIQQYQAANEVDAIGSLQQARVAKSNADAAARAAVRRIATATQRAKQARVAAVAAVNDAQQQEQAVQSTLANTQTQLVAAQEQLATLNNQRATFLAYQAEQRRLAAIRAAQARARKLAEQRRQEAAAAAAAAARRRHHHNGGGGSNSGGGGGGGGGGTSGPPAPSGGGWTPAKGRAAVARAASTLGTPYAWAGGGVGGPSYGVCDAGAGAPNDCYVRGYDCSGLAMYAWGMNWAHFAATQYGQAGSFHPSRSQLRPGDLVFYGGSHWSIHHVAIYAGNGQIIEAPYSGGYVQYNSVDAYYDYYGATRPLT